MARAATTGATTAASRAEPAATRLPRGTGSVTRAFFAALDTVPDTMRGAVAKAAQGAIRDELKRRLEKERNAARALRVAAHPDGRGVRGAAASRAGRVARGTSRLPAAEQPSGRRTATPKPRGRRRMSQDGEVG